MRSLNRNHQKWALLGFVTLIAVICLIENRREDPTSEGALYATTMFTAKGQVTYNTVNKEVFNPYGYEIINSTVPIPQLRYTKRETCDKIFADWLAIALSYRPDEDPPKEIPERDAPYYNLFGHALLTKAYFNNIAKAKPKVWNQITSWYNEDPLTFSNYGVEGMSVANAMRHMNIQGKAGCVIGSEQPWIEVISLQNGARSLLTVEYQKTTIEGTDKITYIHPIEYAKTWRRQHLFDFAVSWSSIEHSGLQRYGDPGDPIGDIREVKKVRCLLKKGGLFFLGVPRGQDELFYNAHRIYGRIRLAMIFEGFELLHVFRNNEPDPVELTIEDFVQNGVIQDTFVLKKL